MTDISKLKRYPQPVEVRPDFKLTMAGSHAPQLSEFTGKVWPDPREKKRRRFHAWLEVDGVSRPYLMRKKFSTRKAATDWLIARRVENVKQF